MSSKPKYSGEPTLKQVMRRPKWIFALVLALAVAAGFAALAQWQMSHAVKTQQVELDSETVTPIDELTGPGETVTDTSGGRMVSLDATTVASDTLVVANRMNGGEQGYWVVSHVATDDDAHLAVALGWTDDLRLAEAFATTLAEVDTSPAPVVGRYMPSEGPEVPIAGDPLPSMSTAQLVNIWQPFIGDAFSGYLVSSEAPEGLEAIDSVPPLPQETINWLNLFYAVEWLVFAGFAVFFWYRLTRDAWEKEHELRELREREAEGAQR